MEFDLWLLLPVSVPISGIGPTNQERKEWDTLWDESLFVIPFFSKELNYKLSIPS